MLDRLSKTWLVFWIVVTAFSWIIGEVIGSIFTGYLMGPGRGSDSVMLRGILSWVGVIAIGGIIIGIITSFGQWFLLCNQFPKMKWIQATLAGWIVGIVACFVVGLVFYILILFGASFLSQGGNADSTSWSLLILGMFMVPIAFAVGWVGLGIIISLFQRRVLRQIKGTSQYFWKTIFGWILGLPAVLIAMYILQPLFVVQRPNTSSEYTGNYDITLSWLFSTVASGIYGLVVGFASGNAMQKIFAENKETILSVEQ